MRRTFIKSLLQTEPIRDRADEFYPLKQDLLEDLESLTESSDFQNSKSATDILTLLVGDQTSSDEVIEASDELSRAKIRQICDELYKLVSPPPIFDIDITKQAIKWYLVLMNLRKRIFLVKYDNAPDLTTPLIDPGNTERSNGSLDIEKVSDLYALILMHWQIRQAFYRIISVSVQERSQPDYQENYQDIHKTIISVLKEWGKIQYNLLKEMGITRYKEAAEPLLSQWPLLSQEREHTQKLMGLTTFMESGETKTYLESIIKSISTWSRQWGTANEGSPRLRKRNADSVSYGAHCCPELEDAYEISKRITSQVICTWDGKTTTKMSTEALKSKFAGTRDTNCLELIGCDLTTVKFSDFPPPSARIGVWKITLLNCVYDEKELQKAPDDYDFKIYNCINKTHEKRARTLTPKPQGMLSSRRAVHPSAAGQSASSSSAGSCEAAAPTTPFLRGSGEFADAQPPHNLLRNSERETLLGGLVAILSVAERLGPLSPEERQCLEKARPHVESLYAELHTPSVGR